MSRHEWQAFLAMEPPTVTHNDLEIRYARGKPYIGKSDKLLRAEAKIEDHLRPNAPKAPMEGKLTVEVAWCFPTEGAHEQGEPMDDKPDIDNLAKTFFDCLKRVHVIRDDAAIVSTKLTKAWMDPAGIFVRVVRL